MSETPQRIVIIGAGQAGGQAAYSLRLGGFEGEIIIVGDERAPPYQRPPLSKAYLKGELEADRLFLKPLEYYAEHRVELLTGDPVAAIDLDAKTVTLESGGKLGWDRLVIATGARPRKLSLEGAELGNITELRTLADVDRLKSLARAGARMVGRDRPWPGDARGALVLRRAARAMASRSTSCRWRCCMPRPR